MKPAAGRRLLVLLGKRDEAFYGYQALAICRAVAALGGTAVHVETPHVSDLARKLPPDAILDAIRAHQATDVLTVNIPAALAMPDYKEGLGIRWHTWIQDLYDAHTDLPQRPFETRWNWVRRWGAPVLLPATDYGRFLSDTSDGYDFDVSFIGYLPAQALSFAATDPRYTIRANIVYEEMLRLWAAEGDSVRLHIDTDSVEATIARAERGADTYIPESCREAFSHFVAEAGVRFFQRTTLMGRVVDICKRRGWRLAIAGMGWNRLDEFAPYAIGHCVSGEMMAHLAQRTKVNLHMGVEVLFHNRPLEIFACNAFALSWCPGDNQDEGLGLPQTALCTLEDDLAAWVDGGDHDRLEVAARIGQEVRQKHTFEARMAEMLK